MRQAIYFIKVTATLSLLYVLLVSADCNAPKNDTTGGCGPISQTICYVRVGAAQPAAILSVGAATYTFSHQNCVPYYLAANSTIPWLEAMNSGWKFWITSENFPQNACSDLFFYKGKFCGNPVYNTTVTGTNITYPGTVEIYEQNLIKIPISRERAFRFSVVGVTNCNNCICNACITQTYFGASSWQFDNFKVYSASDVEIILNGFTPTFDVPLLRPLSIFFNCGANPTSADLCP